jgi:hypothetical protein
VQWFETALQEIAAWSVRVSQENIAHDRNRRGEGKDGRSCWEHVEGGTGRDDRFAEERADFLGGKGR